MLRRLLWRLIENGVYSFKTIHRVAAAFISQVITKITLEAIREAAPEDDSLTDLAREMRCAAFSFAAALFVATQSKEKVFNVPLKIGALKGPITVSHS